MRHHFLYRNTLSPAIVVILTMCIPAVSLVGQDHESASPRSYEIKKVKFEGNKTFDDGLLGSFLQSKESPGWFAKFLYNKIGGKLGSPPQLFDPAVFQADAERLRQFYWDNGFVNAQVTTSAPIDSSSQSLQLNFSIEEKRRSLIDSVRYVGIEKVPDDVQSKIYANSFIKPGDPYSRHTNDREILRILIVLHDNGYPQAYFVQERSSVLHSIRTNNFTLIFAFHPGKRYTFGDTTVRVEGKQRPDIRDRIMLRFVEYQPGEVYSQRKKLDSERNLIRLGLFETARIELSNPSEEDTSTSIPTTVVVRPKDKHELNPEFAILEENNAFNVGLGMGYTNLNFFGEARSFTTALRFRIQEIGNINFIRVFGRTGLEDSSVVGGVELTFQLAQPYVFSRKLSGFWNFSFIVDKQAPFVFTSIGNRFGFRYELDRTTNAFVDWDLERADLDALEGASETQIIRERPEEERPQFNSIVSFTLQRVRTDDIFSPSDGYSLGVSVEEGGILPAIAEQLGSDLPFSQFYKLTLFGRYFTDLTRDRYTILAAKAKFGFANEYFIRSTAEAENRDLPVPLNRRFFAGGSGSLRGWKTRDLGMVVDPQHGGNALFELSVETRTNFTRGLGRLWVIDFDNIWTVFFVDVGNLWSDVDKLRLSEVAVSAGFGLRYDAIFGPFRIDLGFRAYDPDAERGNKWIFQRKFWTPVVHFGIGQAF